jgi:hypothetical protein
LLGIHDQPACQVPVRQAMERNEEAGIWSLLKRAMANFGPGGLDARP